MRDADVRAAVRQRLSAIHAGDPNTRIVHEMGIWAGTVRIDIAVINGELAGIELKSARDTLDRLDRQAELYNQVFDRVTLVAADRHIERVFDRIPKWWGVTAASAVEGGVRLTELRPADVNDAIDPLQVARLLWRSEALASLERHGLDRGIRSKPVEVLAQRLANGLSPAALCGEVRAALKSRSGWLRQPVSNELDVAVHAD